MDYAVRRVYTENGLVSLLGKHVVGLKRNDSYLVIIWVE